MDSFDIAIVGAGPAGALAAKLLGVKYRVLLLERRAVCSPWNGRAFHKCCGGLLAPDAQKSLATLGIFLPEKVIGGPQLFAVRSIDLCSGDERFYQRFYLNIDRESFDRYLIELACENNNITLYDQSNFLNWSDNIITFSNNGIKHQAKARRLIAADGAASVIRRHYGTAADPKDCYVAIQECYKAEHDSPYFSAFFDPENSDFYGWTIPKNDGLLFGIALKCGGDAPKRFESTKEKLSKYGFNLGEKIRREGALLLRPRHNSTIWYGKEDIWAIGEAGGWISPSSAEGFSFAFESAKILAALLLNNPDAKLSNFISALRGMRLRLYGKQLKSPLMYNSFFRRHIMRSGLTSIKIFRNDP